MVNPIVPSLHASITGYISNGKLKEALLLYRQMQKEDSVHLDLHTIVGLVKACGKCKDIGIGLRIHVDIVGMGLLEGSTFLMSTLVDMYAKCGFVTKAKQVFMKICNRDVVSWTSLITGYCDSGNGLKALECLEAMKEDQILPNDVTFVCVLRACSYADARDKGREIHEEIERRGLLETSIFLGSALVDMYVKFGMLVRAQEVLEELSGRDLISWSVLIAGYAQQGQSFEAFSCFERMRSEGFTPDKVTFQCLLSACSHSGLMGEAQFWLRNMTQEYNMIPDLQHRACMVVVFGSMGLFAEAISMTKVMTDSLEVCLTVLSACKKWGNVKQVQKISP